MSTVVDPRFEADQHRLAGRHLVTSVTAQDEIVRGHLVHGTPVLPGVFFLDLVLRLLRHAGVDPAVAELRRCLFIAPVVAAGDRDRQLQIAVDSPSPQGVLPVTVRSRPVSAGVVLDEAWETNFQAEIRLSAPEPAGHVDTDRLKAAADQICDADALYAFARQVDIHHRDFMKVDGTVYRGDGYSLGDVRLGPDAQEYLDHFHIHPVTLDFSTLVPFLQFESAQREQAARPFIPIYIESFRAHAPLGAAAQVYVPRVEQRELDAETVTADLHICHPDGSVVARITGFRAKRVRSADLITRLAEGATTPAQLPPAPRPPKPADPPAAEGQRTLETAISDLVAEALGSGDAPMDQDRGFYDLGLDSVNLLTIAVSLEKLLDTELYPTLLFEYPTVNSLAAHLRGQGHTLPGGTPAPQESVADQAPAPRAEPQGAPRAEPAPHAHDEPIAVVGLAGRYPGAADIREFWQVLRDGRDCVSEVPPTRWDHTPWFAPGRHISGKTHGKWGGFLDGVEDFDPLFFNISPRQAELMDPHERLFLETAWQTVEDAGYTPEQLVGQTGGAVGVFAGVMWNDYQLHALEQLARDNPQIVASTFSLITSRVSYAFDFRGPSVSLDTACSSSLTTIHLACEAIRRGECRAALAGGVNLSLHPFKYLRLAENNLLSTDGRCRVFGEGADGYVPGEGVGAVLLRPLSEAEAAGDHIYGVIRGSAVQHSGRTSGFAVPSPDAQGRVVLEALRRADVDVETITSIEAHGAGTTLGDQIEIASLTKAYRRSTDRRGFCAVGSLKSNVGHLEAAAGIAALTKVLLSMRHGTIVPTLHTERLNQEIPFDDSPFYVARERSAWPRVVDPRTGQTAPRRAGISAFGFGGANVHMVLEEYQPEGAAPSDRPAGAQVVPLSARTPEALRVQADRLRRFLSEDPDLPFADVAHTLRTGRRALEHRLAVVAHDTAELVELLTAYGAGQADPARVFTGRPGRDGGGRADGADPARTAAAWVRGAETDWATRSGRRVPLPTYPFERKRCWIPMADPAAPSPAPDGVRAVTDAPDPVAVTSGPSANGDGPAVGGEPTAFPAAPAAHAPAPAPTAVPDGLLVYEPVWARRDPEGGTLPDGVLLVLDDDSARVAELRRRVAARVVAVRAGTGFARTGADEFTVDPTAEQDHRAVAQALRAEGADPAAVLDLWPLSGALGPSAARDSAFALARAWLTSCTATVPVVYAYASDAEDPEHAAVGGLARGVRREQPKLALKTVCLDPAFGVEEQCRAVLAEAVAWQDIEVRVRRAGREVLGFRRVTTPAASDVPLARDGGTYLITGGAGGLGRLVARRLAERARVRIALVGRSVPGAEQSAAVAELTALGAQARYYPCDVTDRAAVADTVAAVVADLGPLTGVLHAAGVVEDGLLLHKDSTGIQRVTAPKILGTRLLDEATRDACLDYFLLFSSTTSVLGTIGTTDYTTGNRYLDSFAHLRQDLRARGERHGRTLSVNWPLWADGGMRINPAVEQPVLEVNGLEPLSTSDGLAALEFALGHPAAQLAVFRGDVRRLEQRLTLHPDAPPAARPGVDADALCQELAGIFADVLKVPVADLDPEEDLSDYGVDSIAAMRVLDVVEQRYGTAIVPSVVARRRTLRALADHLAGELPAAVSDTVSSAVPQPDARDRVPRTAPTPSVALTPSVAPPSSLAPATVRPDAVRERPSASGRIAVVAAAVRVPGAASVEEFWQNLVRGIHSVSRTPADRWSPDWFNRADPDVVEAARWGGFIEGIDRFDAEFFGISEQDAAWMDPQQRLSLELAQELLDRAGYARKELAGERVGVFLGVGANDYVRRNCIGGPPTTPQLLVSALPNMVATQISHVFDFRGPSLAVDTACSSSLVAVHQAVQSLLAGECDHAVAGGCELLLDPFVYLGLGRAGVLSRDGHSRVFDREATGTVPGEGLGMVLLKTEEQALRDGDQVLATLLASAVNNDGRTLGLTAPSHEAQTELLRTALRAARVDSPSIGYLEVNGSASRFGDPIEIHAAAEVYRGLGSDSQHCAVGSVKSNVGALLHAGGIASLIKTVLAVQHGYLPATLHCDDPHPRLGFERTPFYPVTSGRPWPETTGSPRRAAVSSFGFGGTNCHVVLEQAPEGHTPRRTPLALTRFDRRRRWITAGAGSPGSDLPPASTPRTYGEPPAARTGPDTATAAEATPMTSGDPVLDAVTDHLDELVRERLGTPVPPDRAGFLDLGLTSADLMALNDRIESDLGCALVPTVFFRHPDVPQLAAHLRAEFPEQTARLAQAAQTRQAPEPVLARTAEPVTSGQAAPARPADRPSDGAIAVIGMAGRFPGAHDTATLWQRLLNGDDLVTDVPAERWDHRAVYDPQGGDGRTDCPRGGFVADADSFDAGLFGMSRDEAQTMDPQTRLLLEVLWETAEDAAVAGRLRGSDTGVFVGRSFRDYEEEMIRAGHAEGPYAPIGTAVSMSANRPSHFFDLTGPSLTVDTACSGSLYAVHLAVNALRRGECRMALAAGTNLILTPRHYTQLSAIGALSPSGACHAFDDRADGYAPAEAVAAVLLKPLADALRDGDPVHAVIKGSAVNHGGRAGSVTAPNPARQTDLLRAAWADAGISPDTLGYLEAHGTGTRLGDPVEVDGLTAAFAEHTSRSGFCVLGTAKAHLGHTEAAAGLTGLIKAVLTVRHGVLPAMPGYAHPNPYCTLDDGPLRVNRSTERWETAAGTPRRAGVSSFGFGGAYAHVVLEQAPQAQEFRAPTDGVMVFPYSAADDARLREVIARQRSFVADSDVPLASIAATLQHGRFPLPARAVVVAADRRSLLRGLDELLATGLTGDRVRVIGGNPEDAPARAARLWTDGTTDTWPALPEATAPRVSLPTYPFARERHGLTRPPATLDRTPAPASGPAPTTPPTGPTRPDTVPHPVPGTAPGTSLGSASAAAAERAADAYLRDASYDGRKVAAALRELGVTAGRMLDADLRARLGRDPLAPGALDTLAADPSYERLTRVIEGVLRRSRAADPSPFAAGELKALLARHPELSAHVRLVAECLPALPDVLAGRVDPLELYFSGEHPDVLADIYRGNAIADHYNELVARAVHGFVSARLAAEPGRPVRIVEAGAGTGGTTDRVLQLLATLGQDVARVGYRYTDVSASFFRAAEREFGGRGVPLRFDVLDLEADPAEQGFAPGCADLVLAANVVHATRRVSRSLGRLRGLLADGGVLVLNEVTCNLDYLALMFGMIPGWWAFEEPAERLPGAPLLDVPRWRTALATAGFDGVRALGAAGLPEDELDQSVLLAAASGPVPTPATGATPAAADSSTAAAPVASGAAAGDGVLHHLASVFAEFLRVPLADMDPTATFDRYGLDSLGAIQLVRRLEQDFGPLPKVLLYECTTLDAVARHLREHAPDACAHFTVRAADAPSADSPTAHTPAPQLRQPDEEPTHTDDPAATIDPPVTDDPVVIVGLSARFPGSPDLDTLWRNLHDGADLVTEIPAERFDWRRIYGDPVRTPGRTNSKWGAFIDGVAEFDAGFFGISPLEADLMDPQQRLFLQAAWAAVEDAGHSPSSLRGTRTGVFVGATSHDYDGHLTALGRDREAHSSSGLAHCIIANRVSYLMDLHGPSQSVDTACSSSLFAFHAAVQAIRSGDCDQAIAGGVHLLLTEPLYVALGQTGMLSPTGRCRTFDESADGFVRGEGVAAVLLKPLSRALADGDTVHAVVRGSGTGHGGHVQSLTVPNPAAQAGLVSSVLRGAGVDPRTVSYVEAHGTGTVVGDPIEVRGLRLAFAELTGEREVREPWCGLGTIKSNMGHLEAAAGIAGLVKVVLAMRHGILPASIHYQRPNPLLELEGSPFHIVGATRPWHRLKDASGQEIPRRAGISSMGFGGGNAHVLLEEPPPREPATSAPYGPRLFVLSARDEDRLRAAARRLDEHLGRHQVPLDDLAFTLQEGRDAMTVRLALVAADQDGLREQLDAYLEGRPGRYVTGTASPGVTLPTGPVPADPLDWGRAWTAGADIAWSALRAPGLSPRRVSLPGYPFAPERHWADPVPGGSPGAAGAAEQVSAVPDTRLQDVLEALQRGELTVDEVDRLMATSENGSHA
ncbi:MULTISPECIES: SDR family NAD(P)-dependent oxidoreductase [unclassified Streptomyces]|uniref:SDR family NAD(P)-dependent oxidoreductase n=1 Tax=unclassified Streptomyces TaxID=2593676 RepID=UPI0036E4BBE0